MSVLPGALKGTGLHAVRIWGLPVGHRGQQGVQDLEDESSRPLPPLLHPLSTWALPSWSLVGPWSCTQ